jgi:hypothetical protein
MSHPTKGNPAPRAARPGQTPPKATSSTKRSGESAEQAIARKGKYGEGSYEGTREYAEGYEEFAQSTSPDESVEKGKKIDTNDPALKEAEERAKRGRTSSTSIH